MEINIGDIFMVNEEEWTVWLIQNDLCHLKNKNEEGICCTIDFLKNSVKLI